MDSESPASEGMEPEYKVVVLGDGAVGKTSLIRRYCEQGFDQSYKQTIGLDFYSKKVEIPGGRSVGLQIWDIGGQQIGGSMLANYLHGADAVCFVYDVTNPVSFKNVEEWHQCVLALMLKEKELKPMMVLAGNKTDLPNRQISAETHGRAADAYNMHPLLISARSGDRINSLFMMLAAMLAGVSLSPQELDIANRMVVSIDSQPEEQSPALCAYETVVMKKKDADKCVLM
ncbi:small GTP-binding protein Rab28 [Trypanosoma rangeli]|uniref:Small GTP-binding protein Rab28 n=1 Tax=Trypanosoma rangeli TaxID=5698 RepID=A0A422P3H9_TRYRA|nr:small GTP-binding protein Rab28 [Trypanosoma rangeli]RNF12281.1 small GTP-binding protein Rab28 [Trypanosoma rangeli]|eukprot:RNF12281.1 small GTP-binding protein Rab28 [Trypanosoma rangeli]